jgi:hypothetical protein
MWENRQDPEPDDLTQRFCLSRQSIALPDKLPKETRVILLSSMRAIQGSRKRIEESDRFLSQYIVLPDHWSR